METKRGIILKKPVLLFCIILAVFTGSACSESNLKEVKDKIQEILPKPPENNPQKSPQKDLPPKRRNKETVYHTFDGRKAQEKTQTETGQEPAVSAVSSPLMQAPLSSIKIDGVILSKEGNHAMVHIGKNKSTTYIIHEGQTLGSEGGKVVRIGKDDRTVGEMVVEYPSSAPETGQKMMHRVVLKVE